MVLFLQKTAIDWQYYAEKSDKASLSIPNGTYWPRGKVLGGCSAINAMIYLRGNRRDYDNWKEMGNPGWGAEDAMFYFKKSEDNKLTHLFDEHGDLFHGKGGPLTVNKFWNMDEDMKLVLQDAFNEKGYKEYWDLNGGDHIGFASVPGTIDKGERVSTASAFLAPNKDRKNLHVIKNALVTELEFSKEKKNEVVGVRFQIGDNKLVAKAKKETILSAGTVNTPQLLMLSGIGPRAHLEDLKIPVKADLSVGLNLQDHVIVPYYLSVYRTKQKVLSQEEIVNNLYSYFMHRLGPVAGLGTTDWTGFINTKNSTDLFPDIQIHNFYYRKGLPHFTSYLSQAGYSQEVVDSLMEKHEAGNVLVFYVVLLKQAVPGKIELRSKNPEDPPKIFANYLDDQEEIATFTRGLRLLQELHDAKAFKIAEAEEIRVKISACDSIEYSSDAYWECYIRHMSTTLYHAVGTAKMGPDSDPHAVVDSELKVKKVDRLRVIDASIMPIIPSANTNAATIMVGEKGSDLIKSTWDPKRDEIKKEEL